MTMWKRIRLPLSIIAIALAVGTCILLAPRCLTGECISLPAGTALQKFMNTKQFLADLHAGQFVLVDVREPEEWKEGHIDGAVLIPLGSISATSTNNLPHNKPIYIYCRSGHRAKLAEGALRALGFDNATAVGGILDWQSQGGALVK